MFESVDGSRSSAPGTGGEMGVSDWRMMNVKVKTSSSSLLSLRRKFGGAPGCAESKSCTNSIGLVSPKDLVADTLVAGNALGTMLSVERLRGWVTERPERVKRC
jgi:hypothetical protein